MSQTVKTEAIVLKKRNLLGKDNFVTFLTEKEGKLSAIAKGIKKITSRRASHIQTGNLIVATLSNKSNRFYLQETSLISAFSTVKSETAKLDYLYLLLFTLDRMLPELQRESKIYNLTKKFLVELAATRIFSKEQTSYYLHSILYLLGYHKGGKTWSELLRYIEEIIHEKLPLRSI